MGIARKVSASPPPAPAPCAAELVARRAAEPATDADAAEAAYADAAEIAARRAVDLAGGVSKLAEKAGWVESMVQQLLDDPSRPDYPLLAIDVERATGVSVEELCPTLLWYRDVSGVIGYAEPAIGVRRAYLEAAIRNQYRLDQVRLSDPLALAIEPGDNQVTDAIGYGCVIYDIQSGQTVDGLLREAQALFTTVLGLINARSVSDRDHEGDAIARLVGMAQICVDRAYNKLASEYAPIAGQTR